MRLTRKELIGVLHAEGRHAEAEEAVNLPVEIDTERDADKLAAMGLDEATIRARLPAR